MIKFSKLFHQSIPNTAVFEDRIVPIEARRKYLHACKTKISDHLRPSIREATKSVLGMAQAVEPRFRTQGSWSYSTCVEPASTPPQEMDWDYGVYLPVAVWEENGPPRVMAKLYFELVEKLLLNLCDRERWELVDGKDNCIRIQVAPWAHIDLPLYAAPEEEFNKIRESPALEEARLGKALASAGEKYAEFAEAEEPQQQWADLYLIVMATRKGDWKASDPELVARWFKDRVEEHGEQLRRVCRYLKAWRDIHWKQGGPTSVSLMIAATQGFARQHGRDDLALEHVAKHLAKAFLSNIYEQGIDDGVENFNRLELDCRALASDRFQQLASVLERTRLLGSHQKDQAIFQLQQQFGSRLPSDPELVEPDNGVNAIRTTPPQRVPPPVVRSSVSG